MLHLLHVNDLHPLHQALNGAGGPHGDARLTLK